MLRFDQPVAKLPAPTLVAMLDGPERVAVVDVREDDYGEHGHIRGALNVPAEDLEDDEALEALITRLLSDGIASVVFHCSLSQCRGPTAARRFRNRASGFEEEGAVLPAVFVLDGGFERFRATPSCRRWVVATYAEGQVEKNDAEQGAVEVPEWAAVSSSYVRTADRPGVWEGFDGAAAAAAVAERASLRALRRWDEADAIHARLAAEGVEVLDKERTWSAGPHKAGRPAKPPPPPLGPDAPACTYCGQRFSSRNALFKHLKDTRNKCGAGVSEAGGIESAPSEAAVAAKAAAKAAAKLARREQRAARREQGERTARHAAAECCLWLGDIPRAWSFTKRLQMVIFKLGPRGVPQPWVKTVVRKAYRSHDATREQLGYAVVAFRDAEEAELVLAAMDGLHVSAAAVYGEGSVPEELNGYDTKPEGSCFTLRVRRCENGDTAAAGAVADGATAAIRGPGLDPPLAEQLRPLTTLALQRRVQLLQALGVGDASTAAGNAKFSKPFVLGGPKGAGGPKASALARAVEAYTERPRTERHLVGSAVPAPLAASLLAELQSLRWPAKNERAGLTSERYLVLPTNSAADFYAPLRALCAALMAFAEPSFYYSSIAVTKNFVASPHIDERDRTHQFAMSLGDFEGGELCVDEEDCEAEGGTGVQVAATSSGEHVVAVVNTRNRVAKVDGRHIHWVRSFTGGDRYSLIFFDTSDRAPTPVGTAVDAAWKPYGLE